MGWEKPPTSFPFYHGIHHHQGPPFGRICLDLFPSAPNKSQIQALDWLMYLELVAWKTWKIDVIIIILLGGDFRDVLFSPRKLGKISNLTNIFQMGWNNQLVILLGGLLTFITVNQCFNFQLIWWFGAWWFGSLRSPKMNPGLLLRGAPSIQNHRDPNHQFTVNMYPLKWKSLDMSYAHALCPSLGAASDTCNPLKRCQGFTLPES